MRKDIFWEKHKPVLSDAGWTSPAYDIIKMQL